MPARCCPARGRTRLGYAGRGGKNIEKVLGFFVAGSAAYYDSERCELDVGDIDAILNALRVHSPEG